MFYSSKNKFYVTFYKFCVTLYYFNEHSIVNQCEFLLKLVAIVLSFFPLTKVIAEICNKVCNPPGTSLFLCYTGCSSRKAW